MTPDLHFHIAAGFSGTITVNGDHSIAVVSAAAPISSPASTWPSLAPDVAEEVEEMLKRQESHEPTTRSRDITTVLVERGWQSSVNLKGAYLRFEYAGNEKAVSLYLNSKALKNNKKGQHDFMATLPGVEMHSKDAHIPINGSAYDQALTNIEAIEKWTD